MDNKYNELIDIIKSNRISCNLGGNDIANNIGISAGSYSLKENNKTGFNFKEIIQICNMLNIDVFLNTENNLIQLVDYDLFIDKLIQIRELNNYTKDSFRINLGMSYPTYANKENKKIIFNMNDIFKILKLLNMNLLFKYTVKSVIDNVETINIKTFELL